ncbi:DMT family transporter [Limibacillus halophilus]|jgi:O-acetylserine/cysteine efflux transporter
MKPTDVLIALTVPVLWGLGLVIAKPAVDLFPPILLMSLRFGVTAALLVWFVPIPRRVLAQLFFVALIGSTLQYGLTFNGLRLLDASTTALIVQAEVPFLALIAAIWLGEKLGLRKVFGMIIAFAGIYLIAGEPRIEGQFLGIGLVLSGAFMWALGQVMMRRLGEIGGITAIAWVAVMAAPQLLTASLLLESDHLQHLRQADLRVWGAVIYLGVVMTAIGYGCWYHVLGRYEVNRVAPFILLTPVTSVLGGALFLGEEITLIILAGGFLVIFGVGVIVVERSAGRRAKTVSSPPAQPAPPP